MARSEDALVVAEDLLVRVGGAAMLTQRMQGGKAAGRVTAAAGIERVAAVSGFDSLIKTGRQHPA